MDCGAARPFVFWKGLVGGGLFGRLDGGAAAAFFTSEGGVVDAGGFNSFVGVVPFVFAGATRFTGGGGVGDLGGSGGGLGIVLARSSRSRCSSATMRASVFNLSSSLRSSSTIR